MFYATLASLPVIEPGSFSKECHKNRLNYTYLSGNRHRHARVTAAAAHKPLHAIPHRFLNGRFYQIVIFICAVPQRSN